MAAATRVRRWLPDVRAALPGWVAARVLVGVAWLLARWWIDHHTLSAEHLVPSGFRLFAWDGSFYRGIAQHGYAHEDLEALRFFPLYPLLGRAVHDVVRIGISGALLLVSNGLALVAGALLHRLVRDETGDARTAARAATLLALVPPSFVLVWAYGESLFLVLVIGAFLAMRRDRWWWAAAGGFLAALTRPTAVFLAVGAAVEARPRRGEGVDHVPGRVAAILAPLAGAASFVWWVGREFGDWHLPIRIQNDLRGGTENPIVRVLEAGSDLVHLDKHGLHFPFAIALVVLAVVVARRLPASYAWFTGGIVLTSLAATNLNSIERYGLNAFPLVIALALLTRRPVVERLTVVVCGAGFVGLCVLAWIGVYVP